MSAYLKKIFKSKNDFKAMLHASASIESAVIMLVHEIDRIFSNFSRVRELRYFK